MNFLTWLLQVNICLILFYSCYKLFLEHETFFRLNRFYLLCSATLSFFIPLIRPLWMSSLTVTRQVSRAAFAMSQEISLVAPSPSPESLSAWDYISIVYGAGVAIFLLLFLRRITIIYTSAWTASTQKPCSFFKKIFIPEDSKEKKMILTHEYVHVAELHSADVLFFELVAIVNWFNPFVYFYKKSIKHVHEFIADKHTVTQHQDKLQYALLLLSESFGKLPNPLTNSFYHPSLLKKRIIMLQKSKSGRLALVKYTLALPLLAVMLILSSAKITDERIVKIANSIRKSVRPLTEKSEKAVRPIETKEQGEVVFRVNKTLPIISSLPVQQADTIPPKPVSRQLNEVVLDPSAARSAPIDFAKLETPPSFPGGQAGIARFVAQNFRWPKAAQEAGLSGRVIMAFIVEKDGSVTDIRVLRDLGLGTGAAAVAALKEMPKWSPGILDGQPVRVSFTLPLALSIGGKNVAPTPRPIYIIDGKVFDAQAMTTLRADTANYNKLRRIMTTPALSGQVKRLTPAEATEKFGESGKNGAIVVNTTP